MKSGLAIKAPLGILLFFFFFSAYAFTMTGRIRFGDEGERYLTAQSLVERHDLAIRIQPDLHRKIGVDGRNYSSYELGSILPLIPFYALGSALSGYFPFANHNWIEMLFVGMLNPFITALTVFLLFKSLLAFGSSTRHALIVAALFGFATIAWPYAKAFEREPLLAFFLLLSIYTAYKFRQGGRSIWLWATGASAGFLVFAKITNIILLPFFALYLLFAVFEKEKKPSAMTLLSDGVIFSIPIALFVGTQAISNQVRFGSFTDLGLASTWGNPLSYFGFSNMVGALGGMFFSPGKSIFIYSPPAVLFLLAWFSFIKQQKIEALLLGSLIVVSILFNAMNVNWDQPTWWGPKYLVPLTPLFLLPIAPVLDQAKGNSKRTWSLLIVLTALVGFAVQFAAVLIDDREYFDVTGVGIDLAGAIDFLRHGALDSLVLYLSPTGSPIQINPYGILLISVAALFGIWIVQRIRRAEGEPIASRRLGAVVLALVLLIEFAAFAVWIVAPYSRVLAAKANTKFVAGNLFLADARKCEAAAMYRLALERETTYQREAVTRLDELAPHARGVPISADDLMAQVEMPDNATVDKDETSTILGEGSLMLSLPMDRDAIVMATSNPIGVQPNTTYELSGWMKTEAIYGSGYAAFTVFEDDGNWANGRTTDIVLLDETHGWQPFWKSITTRPTTRRIFVKASLWKTYGTVWVDGIQLAQITEENTPSAILPTACK